MIHILIFNFIQVAICLYAFIRGGRPERVAAILLLAAAAGTFAVPYETMRSYTIVDRLGVGIDLALLCGLVALALFANRFWPIWLAALHLLAIASHGIKAAEPTFFPWLYAFMTAKMAYPMLLILLIGTMRHRRRGEELDWA